MSVTAEQGELQVLLVGKNSSENMLWISGKILIMPLNVDKDLVLGKFYILKSDQTLELMTESPFVTKVIQSKFAEGEVHVLVQAPVFIGNKLNAKQYIGCNVFFGRIFIDNSYSLVKLQQFKTFLCSLEFSVNGKLGCFWKSRRVITQLVQSPLECFLIPAKVDSRAEDFLVCISNENQGELQIRVERSDLQENAFTEIQEFMPISIVYLHFFGGQYLSCFSTLSENFDSRALQKAPLVDIVEYDCCGPNCGRVLECLRTLIGDTYFWEHTLADRPDLREDLLNLFL